MTFTVIQVAFFCLVPAGGFLLIKGIQLLKKFAATTLLLEMPLNQPGADFLVATDATYSIWQSGRFLNRAPVSMPPLTIYKMPDNKVVPITNLLGNVTINNGITGRIQVFDFWAAAGQYRLSLTESTGASLQRSVLPKRLLRKTPDLAKYSFQIREKKPAWLMVLGILIILLSAICIITGFVVGVNANELIN